MRIEMAWRASEELLEARALAPQLVEAVAVDVPSRWGDPPRFPGRTATVWGGEAGARIAGQNGVKPDAQRRQLGCESRRLGAPRRIHHEARTGHDPVAMRLDDSTIDSGSGAEVVRVDDQVLHGRGAGCRGEP